MQSREVAIERIAEDRTSARDHVVVEAPLQIRARGTPVATIMRTPGHDLELVRGLLHAEGIAGTPAQPTQIDDDAVEVDVDATAFAGRGLLASAACGVCGRVAIADLELKAKEVTADTTIEHAVLVTLPDRLRSAQQVFGETGGLHGAGLFTRRVAFYSPVRGNRAGRISRRASACGACPSPATSLIGGGWFVETSPSVPDHLDKQRDEAQKGDGCADAGYTSQ